MSFAQDSAKVTKVIDGDTFEVYYKGQKIRCRLGNVDAPEKDQFYGSIAADSLSNWVLGKVCRITYKKKDLYGRQLVALSYKGINADEWLVYNGWAWHYEKYSTNKAKLNTLQANAQAKKRGLWVCEYNVPPQTWRTFNKRNKLLYEKCK